MAYYQEDVDKMETSVIEHMRILNKRTVNVIFQNRAKNETLLESRVKQKETEITQQLEKYEIEVTKTIKDAELKGQEFAQLTSDVSYWKKNAEKLKEEKKKLVEKEQILLIENAKLQGELQNATDRKERYEIELETANSQIETLEKMKKEQQVSLHLLQTDMTTSKKTVERLQTIHQHISKEKLIAISVEDICKAIAVLQDTFRDRIKNASDRLVAMFKEEAIVMDQRGREQYQEFSQQSEERFKYDLDKICTESERDIRSVREQCESKIQLMQETHEKEIQIKMDSYKKEIKELKEHHDLAMTQKSETINQLISEKRLLVKTSERLQVDLNQTKKHTIQIVVQLADIKDVDEVRFHLSLYTECISILENMERGSDINITSEEVESLWRRIHEWREQDVPDNIKDMLDQFQEHLKSCRSHHHDEDKDDKQMHGESEI